MPGKQAKTSAPQVVRLIGGNMPSLEIDSLSSILNSINSNPYMIGVFYIFLNLGGRFLSLELTKRQEWFLALPIVRPFILFSVMFIATRNIGVAFWATIIILSVLWLFANENSAFCLIPSWRQNPNFNDEEKSYSDRMKEVCKKEPHHDEPHHDEHHLEPNNDENHLEPNNDEPQQQDEQQEVPP